MKTLVIDCSPRRGGNSDKILAEICKHFSVDSIVLRDKDYEPCYACGYCEEAKKCVMNDDATEIYSRFHSYDNVIFVAPVYFNSFDAHTKAFIDRAQFMWSRDRKAKFDTTIHLISVGGQINEDNFMYIEKVLRAFAITMNVHFGKTLFFPGVDARDDILEGDRLDRVTCFVKDILS